MRQHIMGACAHPTTFYNFKSVTLTRNYELPEDDLKMDRNMLERFKRFNATILD
jgi:hypothetical protein